jgi:hypothetical protein
MSDKRIHMIGDIPVFNADDADQMESLRKILADDPYGGDRSRPYLGQRHTDLGERGKTEVRGLTMRDIGDCIRRGQILARAPGDRVDYDEIAVIQNAMCEVERMMGIFPNVPRLRRTAEVGED